MSAENKVVLEYIKAINSFDLETMSQHMHEDHMYIGSEGSVTCGKKCMLKTWETFFNMFPDYTITVEHIINSGNLVAVFGSIIGSYNGLKGPHIANKVSGPAAWKIIVEDQSIKLWQEYSDNTEMTRLIEKDRS